MIKYGGEAFYLLRKNNKYFHMEIQFFREER
jgi:hypothetical protein